MSHEERNTWVALVSNLIVNGTIFWRLWGHWASGALAGEEALQVLARTILWMIPVGIVLTIVLTIAFNILFAIATRDESPDFTVDERDLALKSRAMLVTLGVMVAGVLAIFVHLALGGTALIGFGILYAAGALADLAGNVVRLYSYRTGG